MTYAEAVEHLLALGPELAAAGGLAEEASRPPRRFDLAHMRTICAALDNPQLRVPAVLIAGTNGKGSTAATLASILTVAGYRTGLYTSPHLVRVNERIQLARPSLPVEYSASFVHGNSGKLELAAITDEEFARLYTRVHEVCGSLLDAGSLPMPASFFERLTAVGFLYFAETEAEIMILEVGLGGRLDATNVVDPLVSIITDVALDHQEYLGETIAKIAGEKAGILREGGTLVILPQHPEANAAIGVAATTLHVRAINASEYLPPAERNGSLRASAEATEYGGSMFPLGHDPYTVTVKGLDRPGSLVVDSPLSGQHQQRNVALAIATALELRNETGYKSNSTSNRRSYNIANSAIEEGIRSTRWPGRLEFLSPNLLLDVAHNPAGAWTLRSAIAALPERQPRTLIFSCLRDKNLKEMSRILFPLFDSSRDGDPLRQYDHLILAPIPNARATAIEHLLAAARALGVPVHAAPHLAGALAQARAVTPVGGLILAAGSVYLVGEIRRLALAEGFA